MARPTSICISTNTLEFGGAERQRVQLANGLHEQGYHVALMILQKLGPLQHELSADVELLRGLKAFRAWSPTPRTVLLSGTTNTEVAAALVWRFGPRFRRGTRTWMVAAHNPASPHERTYGRILSSSIRLADGAIALSRGHEQSLREGNGKALHRSVHVVGNGIDLGGPPILPPTSRPVQFAFVGRLARQKGLDVLLMALADLRGDPWELAVHGDGPERAELEAQAVRLGLADQVDFRGFTADVRSAFSAAHVAVVPSRNEAFPLVVLEAMAAGRPVLATPVGAIPEIIDGSCGWLQPLEISGWQHRLASIITGSPPLRSMGEQARVRAEERHSLSAMVESYVAVIEGQRSCAF